MDHGSAVGQSPAITSSDVIEDFESVLDVPFITMNRIDGSYVAEVVCAAEEAVTQDRIQQALNKGYEHGVHAYARVHGDYGTILIYFTDDLEDLLDDGSN